jgi:hypothetical protein
MPEAEIAKKKFAKPIAMEKNLVRGKLNIGESQSRPD